MSRTTVSKTYKLWVGGAFVRSESGRAYPVRDAQGEFWANAPQASRKDLRDAVQAARSAQPSWAKRTAYNRGQILYRVAEMLETRRAALRDELCAVLGVSPSDADAEIDASIDRWVYYAGWSDKFGAVLSAVNPVAMPMHTFTVPEPDGRRRNRVPTRSAAGVAKQPACPRDCQRQYSGRPAARRRADRRAGVRRSAGDFRPACGRGEPA
jgi:hypothetical protein